MCRVPKQAISAAGTQELHTAKPPESFRRSGAKPVADAAKPAAGGVAVDAKAGRPV